MEEIMEYQKTYQEYKAELDGEIQKTAEGFVRIGYLLKVARDTNILAESGYKSVAEFAEAEYNLNKTQVSRFISINDKFSEGGYSDHLLSEYKGFGYAKLTLMLQLPDAINEGLTPDYSKSEIQAIKDEVEEEGKISDIEVLCEPSKDTDASLIEKTLLHLGESEPELFVVLAEVLNDRERIKEEMAPQGEKTYSVRIPGMGRMMLMLAEQECRIVNTRSGEKEDVTWEEIQKAWTGIIGDTENPKEAWTKLYFTPYPEKEQIAPVQQKAEKKQTKVSVAKKPEQHKKPEPQPEPPKPKLQAEEIKLHDIEPSIPEPDPQEAEPETEPVEPTAATEEPDIQIPGQDNIENHPEYLPVSEYQEIHTDEEECWMTVRDAYEQLKTRMEVWSGKEAAMETDILRNLYRISIDMAAALENVLRFREQSHE